MGTRWATGPLVVSLGLAAAGCAGELDASRQACIECALREHPNPESLALAEATFRQGCKDGDAHSCSVLGVMYETGHGVVRDERRAARLFGRSCQRGNARACVSMGRMMENGKSVRRDLAGAEMMYDAACRANERQGCFELGRLHADRGEMRRAAKLLGRACDDGYALACDALGVMTQEGRGVRESPARAKSLFLRACRGGHTEACERL